MDYGPEIVSFYGGNDEAYLNFGGAVLLPLGDDKIC